MIPIIPAVVLGVSVLGVGVGLKFLIKGVLQDHNQRKKIIENIRKRKKIIWINRKKE